jgi:hypothetical protein
LDGVSFSEGVFPVGASKPLSFAGPHYPVATDAHGISISSHPFLKDSHPFSLCIELLSPVIEVSDFSLRPLSDLRVTGARLSVTPGGGVWRKFKPGILQRVVGAPDFVSGRGGMRCVAPVLYTCCGFRRNESRERRNPGNGPPHSVDFVEAPPLEGF